VLLKAWGSHHLFISSNMSRNRNNRLNSPQVEVVVSRDDTIDTCEGGDNDVGEETHMLDLKIVHHLYVSFLNPCDPLCFTASTYSYIPVSMSRVVATSAQFLPLSSGCTMEEAVTGDNNDTAILCRFSTNDQHRGKEDSAFSSFSSSSSSSFTSGGVVKSSRHLVNPRGAEGARPSSEQRQFIHLETHHGGGGAPLGLLLLARQRFLR
jgi:hypothetical protein